MDEIIIKYFQEKATNEEKKQLLEWLQTDEENKKKFSEMRDVWLATGSSSLFTPEYKQKAFRKFVGNVENYEKQKKRKAIYTIFTRVAAAVLLLLVSTGVGFYAGKQTITAPEEIAPIAINHYMMGDDSKGPVTLPDGTVVWLHSNSKLTYPEVFTGNNRKVKLEGEGYFHVARNEDMPFHVETEDMEIRVLGTRFNLKHYPRHQITEAVLVSGKVEALLPGNPNPITMQPNQKVEWNRSENTYNTDFVHPDDYILWINDKLVFSHETLRNIFFKMGRWYNIDIACSANVDMDQRLSFTIRREVKEEIFKLLHIIAPINYQISGDQVTITPK